jgi:hypothetical protein
MPGRDDLAERIAAQTPARRELLERLRSQPAPPAGEALHRPAAPATASFSQERLWVLHQLAPRRSDYNVAAALRLRGPADPAALKAALDAVVRRHAVLRTRFDASGGLPVPVIEPAADVPLPVLDLGPLSEPEREAEAARHRLAHAHAPFDLEAGPLLRARLLRMGPERHDLLLAAHHIVCDGWSLRVFFEDFSVAIAALAAGRPADLPSLTAQYADFVAWERERLGGPALGPLLEFWRRTLGENTAPFELPAARPRGDSPTRPAASSPVAVPEPLAAAVRALARSLGTTPFVVLLAALQALLARLVARDDVLVAVPVANRRRHEFEPLIGLFVNTLVLRTDLSKDPAFGEAVARAAAATVGAFDHQELPFAALVQALQPRRGADSAPYTRVAFAFLEDPGPALRLPGLTAEVLPVSGGVLGMDLVLSLREEGGGFVGAFDYPSDLFPAAEMACLAGDYVALLAAGVAEPGRRLRELGRPSGPCAAGPDAPAECSNLTRSQLLVWLSQRLRPDVPVFNEAILAHVRGPLDPQRFRRAFDAAGQVGHGRGPGSPR